MDNSKTNVVDRLYITLQGFVRRRQSGGIVLGLSVILALILANSPWSDHYFSFFYHKFGFQFDGRTYLENNLHHWINDGLMAMFFFTIGLELKREIVAGDLSHPRKALLPFAAAVGGMIVPAIIYLIFNPVGEVHRGWGIPMATDIAFALGVLYLLGSNVPKSSLVFLTALAIVDDLGAVLVIAFFYTSEISTFNLIIGLGFILIMYAGNKMGIRTIWFYALIGIGGVWTAFLLSGVHATISAVIAAFTIPANVKIKEDIYLQRIQTYLDRFKGIDPNNDIPTLMGEQLNILEKVKQHTNLAIPPLQQLEHKMHPFVTFIVLPIFALANAGISLKIDFEQLFSTNVVFGVGLGLLVGKLVGVVSFTLLIVKLKIASLPRDMNLKNLIGLGLIASIGFTMSLFISELAFTHEQYKLQAKVGIFLASIIGGILGYIVLNSPGKQKS